MVTPVVGHGLGDVDLSGFAQFGTDWLYVAVPLALIAGGTLAFFLAGRWRGGRGVTAVLGRIGDGLERASWLPAWAAAPLALVVFGALPLAALGFFWDVAWHIGIGRDEFLFSPPHTALASAFALVGVGGVVSVFYATRARSATRWRWGDVHVPAGAAGLLVTGAVALVGFFVDELWHWAYGLDVSMWSPSHLSMISAIAISPVFAWLLLAEAGPGRARPQARAVLLIVLSMALLEAASAWQLEFDLGVPQWQALYQPVLIALAAGFALVVARTALGRGGALIAVLGFLALRAGLYALTSGAWGLTEPRFPLYLAAGLAVEAAFLAGRRLSPLSLALLAGAAVGTVGLAGEWAWGQAWFWHPWSASLFPGILIAPVVAMAAAVLGMAFGRGVSLQSVRIAPAAVGVALVAVLAGLVVPLPRNVPEGTLRVTSSEVEPGWVDVAVQVTPEGAVAGADRWEVMSWQGRAHQGEERAAGLAGFGSYRSGHQNTRLLATDPGRYVTASPVPAYGDWKSIVRFARDDRLGGVAVYMPADPTIDSPAVPAVDERVQPFTDEQALLLREAHDGPAWPRVVTYGSLAVSLMAMIGLAIAGVAGLDRRTRSGAGSPVDTGAAATTMPPGPGAASGRGPR